MTVSALLDRFALSLRSEIADERRTSMIATDSSPHAPALNSALHRMRRDFRSLSVSLGAPHAKRWPYGGAPVSANMLDMPV